MIKILDKAGLTSLWGKITDRLNNKVDKVSGKGLSTNDYTTAEKNKLYGVAAGANNYVHPATHNGSIIEDGTIAKEKLSTGLTNSIFLRQGTFYNSDLDTLLSEGSYGVACPLANSASCNFPNNHDTGNLLVTNAFDGINQIFTNYDEYNGSSTYTRTMGLYSGAVPSPWRDISSQSSLCFYGVCTTSASTSAKIVSIPDFKLITGTRISVKFSYGNSLTYMTLNISNTGAKSVSFPSYTANSTSTTCETGIIKINRIYDFIYDGTYWTFAGEAPCSNYGYCTTSGSTIAKAVTIQNFDLYTGVLVAIRFSTTNTASSITLNISGSGSKSVYFPSPSSTGVTTLATNVIEANGVYLFSYDGSYWRFVGSGDSKVYMAHTTSNIDYPIALSPITGTSNGKDELLKNNTIIANPYTGTLKSNTLTSDVLTGTYWDRGNIAEFTADEHYKFHTIYYALPFNISAENLIHPLEFMIITSEQTWHCKVSGYLRKPLIEISGGQGGIAYIYLRTTATGLIECGLYGWHAGASKIVSINSYGFAFGSPTSNGQILRSTATTGTYGSMITCCGNSVKYFNGDIRCRALDVTRATPDEQITNCFQLYDGQIYGGQYPSPNSSTSFAIGKGTINATSNAFRIDNTGKTYGYGSFNTTGADYAELFEWIDGNPDNDDRRGYFVTYETDLKSNKVKIRKASSQDVIHGVISANPSIIGNVAEDEWADMWLKDVYGELILEKSEESVISTDENGAPKETVEIVYKPKLNPNYDPTKTYIPRQQRPEWAIVGMLGQIILNDDGSCIVGQKCVCNDLGIGTLSTNDTGYTVLERLDDSHIKIEFFRL